MAIRPTYTRPYGSNAPWNVPVSGLATHPNSSHYVNILYYNSSDRTNNFNSLNNS